MNIDQHDLTARLDRLEATVPDIPAKTIAFGRATARRTTSTAESIIGELSDRSDTIGRSIATAVSTAVGQARSVADRSITTIRNGLAEVTGQTRAQTDEVVHTIGSQTSDLLDTATDAIDPADTESRSLPNRSKSELYDMAQSAGITGRSTMSKDDLIAALRR